ncbi:hypothetical protein BDV29DRAFT_186539 [Aspergillus leporis]|uniref:Secreted protein n=1 Tax=Aspergillus leporis TaxID=41062 RepID=A0A5N5WI66_9EURO|nr:hypothetical protein BDV29DRAFT_186539 [Aspergillus leporis]
MWTFRSWLAWGGASLLMILFSSRVDEGLGVIWSSTKSRHSPHRCGMTDDKPGHRNDPAGHRTRLGRRRHPVGAVASPCSIQSPSSLRCPSTRELLRDVSFHRDREKSYPAQCKR